jgi:hypothetical protein
MKSKNKVLVLCGRKNSGKTMLGNYVTGYLLRQNKVIQNFGLTDNGSLVVNSYWVDEHGATIEGEGILDLNQRTPEHIKFYIESVWPHVKLYSFKTFLSDISKTLFSLENDKKTPFVWSDLFRFLPPMEVKDLKDHDKQNKKVPHSNFLEILDYEIFRVINKNYIVNSLIKQIKEEYPGLSVITDCKNIEDLEVVLDNFENTKCVWIESDNSKKESPKIEKNIEALSLFDFDVRISSKTPSMELYRKLLEWGFIDEYHTKAKTQENTSKIYREE